MTVVLCGCNIASIGPRPTFLVATTSASPGFGFNARLQGKLQGKTNSDGTACFFVTQGSLRTILVWPQGYLARGNPLEVLNENGHSIGQIGQEIALRGGLGQTGLVAGCGNAAQTFAVAEVVPLN